MKKPFFSIKNKRAKNFFSDKRAVSVALSTLIISAAVVAAGISVLYWAYSWGNIANDQYAQTVTSNQNATSERLGFEFTTYSSGKLSVYLINCGQVSDIKIARVYLWDNQGHILGTYPTDFSPISNLMSASDNSEIPSNSLDKGQEGYFTVSNLNLSQGFYTMRVITERGRSFDSSFTA